MPKVSVIIPTYNRGHFVSQAIESILKQTYSDYEIIVVDDGSTDDTRERVARFGDKVRYIKQKNRGPSAARNTGIKRARGKYIAFCDSDDRFLPNKLEDQMRYIQKHPNAKFIYSWYYNVDGNGNMLKVRKTPACRNLEELQFKLFNRKFTIRTSTVIVRKDCFKKVGRFNEKFLYSQDWDMWLRLASHYRGHRIAKPLAEYRLHGRNRSSLSIKRYHPAIRKKAWKLFGWNSKEIKRLSRRYRQVRKDRRRSR